MPRATTVLVLALLALAPLAGAETQSYLGGNGAYNVYGPGVNVGGARFDVLPGSAKVSLTVNDVSGLPVKATYVLKTGSDVALATGSFCGSAANVHIQPGAAWVAVFVGSVQNGGPCGPAAGQATAGSITAIYA